jgi:hypothetical protein
MAVTAKNSYYPIHYPQAIEDYCDVILKSEKCQQAWASLQTSLTEGNRLFPRSQIVDEDNYFYQEGVRLSKSNSFHEAVYMCMEAIFTMTRCSSAFDLLTTCLEQQGKITKHQQNEIQQKELDWAKDTLKVSQIEPYLKINPQLVKLCLSVNIEIRTIEFDQLFTLIKKLTALQILSLTFTYVNPHQRVGRKVLIWDTLDQCITTSLKELALIGSMMGLRGTERLGQWLEQASSLEKLHLSHIHSSKNSLKCSDAIFQGLSRNPAMKLKELNFSDNYACQCSDLLCWLRNITSLEKLDLNWDLCTKSKVQSRNLRIGYLLSQCSQLQLSELHIAGNHQWQKDNGSFFSWLQSQPLIKLDLEGNKQLFKNSMSQFIDSLKNNTHLQELNLKATNLNINQKALLLTNLPNVKIYF